MDDAPMPLTEKGKPDTTARHVLQVLAEHAHPDGTGSRPSVMRIRYRTGYDRRTVQRALRRLELAELIARDGEVNGCTRWKLAMHKQRPASDMAALQSEEDSERKAAAERKRRSRAKSVTHSASVTVTYSDDVTQGDVTDAESGRHALSVRDVTHSASGRHALNAARTTNEPPEEPPTTTSKHEEPAPDRLGYGIPEAARPLVDQLTAADVNVRWPFKGDQWFPVLALIQKSGIPALVDYATRAAARTDIDSAKYFIRGWSELPPQPAPGTERPQLRSVTNGNQPKPRHQQEVDDWYERSLARARARDAAIQEGTP